MASTFPGTGEITGIKQVSELSFGSWITFGTQLDVRNVKECMKTAEVKKKIDDGLMAEIEKVLDNKAE